MIYLDNAATTQVSPEVIDAMTPYLSNLYANPGTLYSFGSLAAKAVQRARGQVSRLMNCRPDHILFTSGGSEANNLVFHGIRTKLKKQGRIHILISAVEHDSVRKSAFALRDDGFDVEEIPVTEKGCINYTVLRSMVRDDTGLISVMYVNNETGTENPVHDIGRICHEKGVWFHTDCVQAAGSHRIDVGEIECDFASISAHKIHGMKGVGALYVGNRMALTPLIHGGIAQEYGLRGGTENVPGIVAFGEACEQCMKGFGDDVAYVTDLYHRFYFKMVRAFNNHGLLDILHCNSAIHSFSGKTLSFRFDGIDGESLVLMLDSLGIFVSAGSACRSREVEPSHVLTAMGLSAEQARSTIRISFSKYNTQEEIDQAAEMIADCVAKLYYYFGH